MPRRRIVIEFEFPQDEQLVSEQSLVSRVRDLGEDLFREFSRNGQAILSLHDVDRAISQLSLTLSSNRHTTFYPHLAPADTMASSSVVHRLERSLKKEFESEA